GPRVSRAARCTGPWTRSPAPAPSTRCGWARGPCTTSRPRASTSTRSARCATESSTSSTTSCTSWRTTWNACTASTQFARRSWWSACAMPAPGPAATLMEVPTEPSELASMTLKVSQCPTGDMRDTPTRPEVLAGTAPRLSADGSWWWDGAHWQPATSPDGLWHWDGSRWAPSLDVDPDDPAAVAELFDSMAEHRFAAGGQL